jgi:hypothetical protein
MNIAVTTGAGAKARLPDITIRNSEISYVTAPGYPTTSSASPARRRDVAMNVTLKPEHPWHSRADPKPTATTTIVITT